MDFRKTTALRTRLVPPKQIIPFSVLQPIPCMEELGNPVGVDVLGILLCLFPGQRSTKR